MSIAAAALAVWYAWRYSRIEIDPDWAMFNLAAFTGAWYGRDFLDCKSPGIHLYYWLLARIVGADIRRVRFAHHLLVSMPGVIVGGPAGLAFVVLVNTGWLLGFHGNVGQLPAGLLFLAVVCGHPWAGAMLVLLSIGMEPKLAPAGVLLFIVSGWWLPSLLAAATTGAVVGWIYFRRREWWGWLVEANLTITRRMAQMRRKIWTEDRIDLTYTASRGLMFIGPWLIVAAGERPDWRYWLPAAGYAALIAAGLVVRDNHYLPLAAWIAPALPAWAVLALVCVDLASGFGYLGDIWGRYYAGLANINADARRVGEWLRDRPGRVWVNGLHSGVYIHARKPPLFGMAEQIEIRENTPERRDVWRQGFKANPPEWVVVGYSPGWTFSGKGYQLVLDTGLSKVFRRL